ncbi:MAG: hypothetical protein MJ124_00130 [Lachnospiraceae bacterium]|nr:hypothetical protein [Lachnospiraceae bacterium]
MKINVERMRYKNDSLSFTLCMFALVADIVQFMIIYSNSYLTDITGKSGFSFYIIGIDIVVNILFMLFAFYVGEELKTYHMKWAVAPVLMGALQIFRMFDFPKKMMEAGYITDKQYTICAICLLISAVCMFIAAVNSFVKCSLLNKLLKSETAKK